MVGDFLWVTEGLGAVVSPGKSRSFAALRMTILFSSSMTTLSF